MKRLLVFLVACSSSSHATSDAPPGSPHDAANALDAAAFLDAPAQAGPYLTTTIDPGVVAAKAMINLGTAIGQGSGNGSTPFTLSDLAGDAMNTETITSATNPFGSTGSVPHPAAGFCAYGATPARVNHVTGAKFETAQTDPMVAMAPFYFPLVYTTPNTPTGNAFGGHAPIIGLFDWRPKDIDEALVVAESDDFGQSWYFMQTVLELAPDYSNPISGGYASGSSATGCPAAITGTNGTDDGWGHAAIVQLPGTDIKTGQVLYMLDRSAGHVDSAPLQAIALPASSNKFPIWNTNNTAAGANDIKSISTALANTTGAAQPVVVRPTVGLLHPDGIMAVFPTASDAPAGTPVTVMYVEKILDGDKTTLPPAQQCKAAPFSGKTNHDISNVRLATTTDGITFTDLGIVSGLNDPTTVDYRGTRWVSPRATLLDLHGDGSLWGMYFAGGNCLDGDSDAFHFIGYAESTDKLHWTVYNDLDHPIASINTITAANQLDQQMVTVPAHAPVIATQPWFAQRLYAPTAVQVDPTHLSLTFAGYGVQSPSADLLNYRQVGNVVVTVNHPLPASVPNNINAH